MKFDRRLQPGSDSTEPVFQEIGPAQPSKGETGFTALVLPISALPGSASVGKFSPGETWFRRNHTAPGIMDSHNLRDTSHAERCVPHRVLQRQEIRQHVLETFDKPPA
jgi:hypothetical protein